jgi:signal transduction histidine kinase
MEAISRLVPRKPSPVPVTEPGAATLEWPFGRAESTSASTGLHNVLAEVAHDLCTPVHSIGATVELLLESFDSLDREEAAHLLQRLHLGTRWLQDLLGDLAHGHLVATPGDELRGGPFSLGQSVQRALPIVQPMLDVRCQQVEITLPGRPAMVWGDEHLLRRVVVNLLSNAAKYSLPQDVIQVGVRVEANWAFVEVRDHGPGVGPLDQGRIFRRRVRGPSTNAARRPDGSGLGLSIVKSLVELHGGKVGVRSEMGSGASFWFSVPRLGSRRSNTLMSRFQTVRSS